MIALDFPNAVTSLDRFYGRKQALSRILATLSQTQRVPVVVIGERRIGKTSIHNVAIQGLKDLSRGKMIPLLVEPRGVQSVEQFIEGILSRLATSCANKDLRVTGMLGPNGHIHLETPAQFDTAFERLIADLPEQQYLLCVDEFDEVIRIASEAGEGERTRLMGLIHHLVENTQLPLGLFLTMTRIPDGLAKEVASPLLAKCEVIELPPFTFAELAEMVSGLVQDEILFGQAQVEWLYEMSGGHPYIAKLLLAILFQRLATVEPPAAISQVMLQQALADAVDDPRANYAFENIYRVHFNADEKRVVLYLAERNEPVESGELRASGMSSLTAARNLEKRHYLVELDEGFTLKAGFLGHWLRRWAEFDEEIERLHVHRMVNPWYHSEATSIADEDPYR